MRALAFVGTMVCAAAAACCFPETRSCVFWEADRCMVLNEDWCLWEDTVYPEEPSLSECFGQLSAETCEEQGFPVNCGDGYFVPAGSRC